MLSAKAYATHKQHLRIYSELLGRKWPGCLVWRKSQQGRFRAEAAPIHTVHNALRRYCQGLLQLQAWVSTKWSPINSFFFTNFNISSVFGIQEVLSYNLSGLHSQTPRPGDVEGLGTAHDGGGNGQSIGSIVSDTIARSWMWSTAARSC